MLVFLLLFCFSSSINQDHNRNLKEKSRFLADDSDKSISIYLSKNCQDLELCYASPNDLPNDPGVRYDIHVQNNFTDIEINLSQFPHYFSIQTALEILSPVTVKLSNYSEEIEIGFFRSINIELSGDLKIKYLSIYEDVIKLGAI